MFAYRLQVTMKKIDTAFKTEVNFIGVKQWWKQMTRGNVTKRRKNLYSFEDIWNDLKHEYDYLAINTTRVPYTQIQSGQYSPSGFYRDIQSLELHCTVL